ACPQAAGPSTPGAQGPPPAAPSVWVALSENITRKRGAKAETSPQAAKQTANDRVPRVRWRAEDGWELVLMGFSSGSILAREQRPGSAKPSAGISHYEPP